MKRFDRLRMSWSPRLAPRGTRWRRGQAITEFALIFPIAVLILAVASTGGQMLISAIDLTQAARAATVTVVYDVGQGDVPQTQQEQDGIDKANAELGQTITCSGSGAPSKCIAITSNTTGQDSGTPLVQVTLWQSITPFIPLIPSITISSQATSAQQ
ncbi:MAG: TadE family protein [Candidatus Dormiibacterota bacterium]